MKRQTLFVKNVLLFVVNCETEILEYIMEAKWWSDNRQLTKHKNTS